MLENLLREILKYTHNKSGFFIQRVNKVCYIKLSGNFHYSFSEFFLLLQRNKNILNVYDSIIVPVYTYSTNYDNNILFSYIVFGFRKSKIIYMFSLFSTKLNAKYIGFLDSLTVYKPVVCERDCQIESEFQSELNKSLRRKKYFIFSSENKSKCYNGNKIYYPNSIFMQRHQNTSFRTWSFGA